MNDLGSETITRLLPLFVSGVLGASMSTVGAIEGVAEATSTLLKPLFGSLSDRLGRRKGFVLVGYALSTLARPFLAFSGSPWEVGFLRFSDRLGKGIRSAPRDALIADSGEPRSHGRNFGINRSMDTVGAVLGVALFAGWVALHGEAHLTQTQWTQLTLASLVPGMVAVLLVGLGITEIAPPARAASPAPREKPARRPLNQQLRRYLVVVALFGLANSSDAFILLRAQESGYLLVETLGMIVLLNLVSAATSIPAAALSDRLGRRALIAMGWSIFALSYLLIGSDEVAGRPWVFAAVLAIYGLFYGFTESVERAWIADLCEPEARGYAFGVFGLVVGATALPASVGFGWVWDRYGPGVAFHASAALSLFATSLLFALVPVTPVSGGGRASKEVKP